jgi:hypothetical protein
MGSNASFSAPGGKEKNMSSEETGQRVLEKQTHPEKNKSPQFKKSPIKSDLFLFWRNHK